MWGIIPAAGCGSRIQPLAFSKELLPVGSRVDGGVEHPRAVSEYLIERMIEGGANKLCFVISPAKFDILSYYASGLSGVDAAYVVQAKPGGFCDAIFRAIPLIGQEEEVVVGLPDTIWFPVHGIRELPREMFSFLLFPVASPELFDAVVTDELGQVTEIQVKNRNARTHWIWGAFKMPGHVFHELYGLWRRPERGDEYFGTLVNAYLAEGGRAMGVRAGKAYVDVGTLHGFREATRLLNEWSSYEARNLADQQQADQQQSESGRRGEPGAVAGQWERGQMAGRDVEKHEEAEQHERAINLS